MREAVWQLVCVNDQRHVSNAIDTLREAVEVERRSEWVVRERRCWGRGALNDLGNAYVAAGDVSNAIDTLREAVKLQPGWCQGTCAERSGQCVCGSW